MSVDQQCSGGVSPVSERKLPATDTPNSDPTTIIPPEQALALPKRRFQPVFLPRLSESQEAPRNASAVMPKRQRPYSVPTSVGTLHSSAYDSSSGAVIGPSDPGVQRRPSTSLPTFAMASMVAGAPQQLPTNMRRRTIVFPPDHSANLPLNTKIIPANRFRSGSMPPIHEASNALHPVQLHYRTSLDPLLEAQQDRMQPGIQSGMPTVASLPRSQIASGSPLSRLAHNGAMNGIAQVPIRIRKPGVPERERSLSHESSQSNGSAWWPIAVAAFPAAVSMFTGTVSMWGELMVLAVLTAFLYQVIRVPAELYNSLNSAGVVNDCEVKTADTDPDRANETTPERSNIHQKNAAAIHSARGLRFIYQILMLLGPFFGAYAMHLTQRWLVYFKPYITEHTLVLFVCSALTRPLSLAISSVHAHNHSVVHRVAGTSFEARVAELESTIIALRESLANSRRDMECAVREGVEPTIEKLAKHVRKVERKEETILKLVEERVEGLERRLRVWEDLWEAEHPEMKSDNGVSSNTLGGTCQSKSTSAESTSRLLIFSETSSIPPISPTFSDDEDQMPGTPNTFRRISDTEDDEIASSTSTVSPSPCARNTPDIGLVANSGDTISVHTLVGNSRANLSPQQVEQLSPSVSSPGGEETLAPSTQQTVILTNRSPAAPDSSMINAIVYDEDAKNKSKPGLWGLIGIPSEMASIALRVGATALSSIVRDSPRSV
ncbi:hypothetical protein BJ742DRAFT_780957 [Cladochytrium replicatum]|nr:hypothetical protein BJ742DRAFT_780957 [Cladochytrium replicatum]